MELFDTHVHLTMPDYQSDLADVLSRAKAAGVTRYMVPGLDTASSQTALGLAGQHPEIIPAVGLHPLSPDEPLEPFQEVAQRPAVKAIGEIGTDSKAGDWAKQEARFRFFLELAQRTDKPVLIHIRDTWEPTFRVLEGYKGKIRGVIHCFTGSQAEAEQISRLGLWLSVTAIIARGGMEKTRAVLSEWPLERLMLETDGPWLSFPGEPWPNEPKTVVKIAQLIADIKGVSVEEVAEKTTQTAKTFFGL